MNEENKKPKITREQAIFLTRVFVFILFGFILPIVFIGWRYQIFKPKEMAFTGWGFIIIFFTIIFIVYMTSILNKIFKHTMFSQCVSGGIKVLLPLIVMLLLLNGIKDNIDAFIQALQITIICECVAIPVNPFPKFIYDNNLEVELEKTDKVATLLFNKWKEMKDK